MMIILETTSIYSGIVGAIVGGIVSLIGYVMTTRVQSKNGKEAIKIQKEIAEMQKNQKLFYESQLQWADKTRELIASFASHCFEFDILANDLKEEKKKLKDPKSISKTAAIEMKKQNSKYLEQIFDLFTTISKEITLIQLYLFHKNNEDELRILDIVETINKNMNTETGIPNGSVDKLVSVVSDYLDRQMTELKEKTI